MDFKKMARCAFPVIAIGILLVIIHVILQIIPTFASGSKDLVKLIVTIYSYAVLPLLFILYFWAGMRAVRQYGMDEINAGMVAAFSSIVIGIVQLILEAILTLLIVSGVILVTDFRPASGVFASIFLGNTAGLPGAGISTLCGLGIIALSAIACFLIGVVGAVFSRRR